MVDIFRFSRRLVAVAVLCIVLTHAAAPFAPSLERASGSAFSGATADVALGRAKPAGVARHAMPFSPAPPLPEPALSGLACDADVASVWTGRAPALGKNFSPLSPRAPPFA